MSIEQPQTFTPEEQAEIEKSRKASDEQFTQEAGLHNAKRPLFDKIRNTDEMSGMDMAHEAALQENASLDKEAAWEQQFQSEMERAKEGEWSWNKSYFYPKSEINLELHATRRKLLTKARDTYLDVLLDKEASLIEAGQWTPDSSQLYALPTNTVDDLHAARSSRFEKLTAFQQLVERKNRKTQEKYLEDWIQRERENEIAQIASGTWELEQSFFKNLPIGIKDFPGIQIAVKGILGTLTAYESLVISKKEQEVIPQKKQEELALIQEGEWSKERSYFYIIQKDPRFQKLRQEIRYGITNTLEDLMLNNTVETQREV
jgi:hypothetical protein